MDERDAVYKEESDRMKRYIKICTAAVLILAAACVLFGCVPKREKVKEKKCKVELWYYWDSTHNRRELRKLIKAFNETQDCIEIEATYIPDEDLKKRLALSIMDNNTPDLVLMDSPDFQYFFSMKESFVDLTDRIEELKEYMPESTAPCTVDGRSYGMPFGVNCLGLYYNKTYFEEAGLLVPTTWKEFVADAAVLSKDGHYGFEIPALQSEESVYSFLPLLWSMGGDVDHMESPESMNAFQVLDRLRSDGSMSEQCISLTMGDLSIQFAEGNIAMMLHPGMTAKSLEEMNPDLDFGVAPLPTGDTPLSVVGGEIFGVLKGDQEDEAVEFLRYLAEKDRMEEYIDNFGFLAAREDVFQEQYLGDENGEVFKNIFASARMREYSDDWPKISMEISKAMGKIIIGNVSKEQAVSEAAETIKAIREGSL